MRLESADSFGRADEKRQSCKVYKAISLALLLPPQEKREETLGKTVRLTQLKSALIGSNRHQIGSSS